MNKNKLLILFILRMVIFGLFIMSGVLKLFAKGFYPTIVPFEKQLVDLGIVNWCLAPFLARLIIAFELALGIAFLQSNYLRRIVIPATAALLIIFCVHLSILIYTQGANSGNCGCFGTIIEMTPLEALIKNILTLGILGYMYIAYKEKEKSKNNILILVTIYLLSTLAIFMLYPFCPCNDAKKDELELVVTLPKDTSEAIVKNSLKTDTLGTTAKKNEVQKVVVVPNKNTGIDTAAKNTPPVVNGDALCLVKKVSAYAPFRKYNDGSVVDLDDGRKIVTLFSLECEHCMETARKIGELSKKRKLPPVHFLFWGSEDQVENFFKVAQCRFPYKIIEPSIFFQLLGSAPSPPKVTFLCNGNTIVEFDNSSFTIEKLEEALNK
ncbi:MAG TPA: DoxX family protein [Cytophagaceae bacterium]|jgi:hypothetical protein|nr:DoxX family protein [Cytophagaceae bacterium]